MTRAEIVALAGKRLGDESTDFLTVVDSFFDQVLRDLAAAECIEQLRKENSFDLVADQESYSLRTMTGLSAPKYPLRVIDLWVPTWGLQGSAPALFRASSNYEFQAFRQRGDDIRGRFQVWQVYPNNATVRVWPPVGSDDAGAGLGRVLWLAPTTTLSAGDDIAEIHDEDLPVIVHGLVYYGAPFRDETLLDVDRAGQLYQAGKREMWGRTHNGQAGRTEPNDF